MNDMSKKISIYGDIYMTSVSISIAKTMLKQKRYDLVQPYIDLAKSEMKKLENRIDKFVM